jgi:predicted phage terminase large subunit-like protein
MQRLNERDTSGVILDMGLNYEHLMIPMRYEPDRKCTTGIGWTDPRTEDGELMFPERFPEEQVTDLEKTLGSYGTAGQLQQRPAPRGGGMFKREDLQIVDMVPATCQWVRGWDLAATEDKTAARTAGVLLGKDADGRFFIKDVVKAQVGPGRVENLLKSTAALDGPSVRGSLPQDPGQVGKAQAQHLVAMLAGYDYRASPESGDKEVRARPVAAQAEAGNLFILRGEWNHELIDEMTTFPVGKFKDQVDALSRAFSELTLAPAASSKTRFI